MKLTKMSTVGTRAAKHRINALELTQQMDIPLINLCRVANADLPDLQRSPADDRWQVGLQHVASLWDDMTQTFGGQTYARAFLHQDRPELENHTPLHYISAGEPEIVHGLIYAMKEMIP